MAKQTFSVGQVLSAAQMTSLQQTAMGGGSPQTKTASYTLVAADAGTVIQMNSASPTTITVNTGLFAAGDSVQIQNIGAGACTITAGTATVNTAGSLVCIQYEGGILYFTSSSAAIYFDYFQAGGSTPLTTKGDLFGFDTANARIPIGSNNQVLTADSTQALGLKWATPSGGGGKVLQVIQDTQTSATTSSSSTYADTGLSVSITPSSATSKVLVLVNGTCGRSSGNASQAIGLKLVRNSTDIQAIHELNTYSGGSQRWEAMFNAAYLDTPATTSATTYKIQLAAYANAASVWVNDWGVSTIIVMEIGA